MGCFQCKNDKNIEAFLRFEKSDGLSFLRTVGKKTIKHLTTLMHTRKFLGSYRLYLKIILLNGMQAVFIFTEIFRKRLHSPVSFIKCTGEFNDQNLKTNFSIEQINKKNGLSFVEFMGVTYYKNND